MSGVVPVIPRFKFFKNGNNPVSNGSVTVYLAGTSTLVNTWQDSGLTILNTNPVNLNANGECTFWLSDASTYRFLVAAGLNGTGATVDDIDNIPGTGLGTFLQAGTGAVRRTAQSKMRDFVSVKDFGAVGDGITDDTTAIQAAIDSGLNGICFPPGVYVTRKLTISSRTIFWGIPGSGGGSAARPRLFLKTGTNDNLIQHAVGGQLDAHNMDFWGNQAGQSGTSWPIFCPADPSGSYVAGNAPRLFNSIVRDGLSGGIFGGTNRNGGGLFHASMVLGNTGDGLEINGADWQLDPGFQIGSNTGNGIVNNADSNDIIGGDIFHNLLSAIVLGDVRICPIIGNQINANGRLGIDASACVVGATPRGIQIHGNTFLANSFSGTNTYSDILIGSPEFSIVGNFHAGHGPTKAKYLVETVGTLATSLQVIDAAYNSASFGTNYTNDTNMVGFIDRNRVSFATTAITARSAASGLAFRTLIGSEANQRFSFSHGGTLSWGAGGASPTDVSLGRTAVGVIGVISGSECLKSGHGVTGVRPDPAVVGVGAFWLDDTLHKPIWSDGTNWRDAAGTIV